MVGVAIVVVVDTQIDDTAVVAVVGMVDVQDAVDVRAVVAGSIVVASSPVIGLAVTTRIVVGG